MKSVIKAIMDKQGINKAELLRQTKIYKIDRILYGKTCQLDEREVSYLRSLFRKQSLKVANLKEPLIVYSNKKEYVNTVACLPNKTQTGFSLYVKKQASRIVVWYQTRARARSESIFKKLIPLNESFVAGLGLSLGDGLNNPSARNTHYAFANTNFHLTYLIFKWLKTYFGLNSSRFQLFLNVPLKDEFVPNLRVLERRFNQKITVYKLNRYKNKALTLQVSNRIFQCIYSSIFNKLKQTILHNPLLRRAFLKGLFAAEGHVKHSIYGTIESMSFAYNPALESELVLFAQNCLRKEGINSKDDKRGTFYFCGYENMIKFYLLRGLSLHKEKEEKFTKLLKNAEIVLHFKNSYLDQLRKYSQHKLAKTLNCSQSAICVALKKRFFPLKHLLELRQSLDVSLSTLIASTEFATIHTSFVRDKEAINFLLSLTMRCKNEEVIHSANL